MKEDKSQSRKTELQYNSQPLSKEEIKLRTKNLHKISSDIPVMSKTGENILLESETIKSHFENQFNEEK